MLPRGTLFTSWADRAKLGMCGGYCCIALVCMKRGYISNWDRIWINANKVSDKEDSAEFIKA